MLEGVFNVMYYITRYEVLRIGFEPLGQGLRLGYKLRLRLGLGYKLRLRLVGQYKGSLYSVSGAENLVEYG